MEQHQGKSNSNMVERVATADTQMPTSKVDDLSVWQSALLIYKRVGLTAMAAAFCAALDGYRKNLTPWTLPPFLLLLIEATDAGKLLSRQGASGQFT
jgi:hypothetical protein